MNRVQSSFLRGATLVLLALAVTGLAHAAAKEGVPTPAEYGIYAKTAGGLKRILPNIVSIEQGVYYVEPNNPQKFPLNSVQYFVVYGKYQTQYLTLNSLKPFMMSPLGKPRFMFGRDEQVDVTKQSETLYTVKPKGLFGRGYYSIWIEDSAWDFVID